MVDKMIGAVLDERFQLVAHVSSGRFGHFWRGKRLDDGADVGIKLLQPDLFADEEANARFERETRLLQSWRHPNLLRVIDSGRTHTGHPWLVTELHRGRLLYDEIAGLTLSVEVVCHIAEQIARTLGAAHARGIVHRGLEPDAVYLVEERGDRYRVKIVDFGLAHLTPTLGEEALTQVGQRIGRAEYMAPEYIEDLLLDGRADLYALGILTFEMLAGQPPFVGPSLQVLYKQTAEQPMAPSDLSTLTIPPWLDELVLALLEKDPDRRPGDAMMVVESLRTKVWPPAGW